MKKFLSRCLLGSLALLASASTFAAPVLIGTYNGSDYYLTSSNPSDVGTWTSNWAGGEPNSGGGYEEDYVVVYWTAGGEWNDLPDSGAGFGPGQRGIIEVAHVPEPGSLALAGLALFAIGFARRRSA